MKGIILAGNSGNRLNLLTIAVPKQLLSLYDKPMVYYPVMTLVNAGIKKIMIITTTEQQPLFKKYLGDGSQFWCDFSYACQDDPKGIAEALIIEDRDRMERISENAIDFVLHNHHNTVVADHFMALWNKILN